MGATLFSVQQEFAAWYRKIWWCWRLVAIQFGNWRENVSKQWITRQEDHIWLTCSNFKVIQSVQRHFAHDSGSIIGNPGPLRVQMPQSFRSHSFWCIAAVSIVWRTVLPDVSTWNLEMWFICGRRYYIQVGTVCKLLVVFAAMFKQHQTIRPASCWQGNAMWCQSSITHVLLAL